MLKKKLYAVVTTDKRGVFFGVIEKHDMVDKTATLKNAQMCVYWSQETHGVLGLAATGPQKGSKVTPIVPRLDLNDVTAVMECTPEAVKKWKAQPWQ